MRANNYRLFIKISVLFIAYFYTARIGLSINAVSGFAAAVWPPTGIALAAVFIWGNRVWPGVFLAALVVNYITGAPFLIAIGIGIGNTAEALTGSYLLKSVTKFQPALLRIIDVLGLIFLAALLSTTISATIGVLSLFLGGVISYNNTLSTWVAWWIGDMLGVLIFASLIFSWNFNNLVVLSRKRLAEADIAAILLVFFSAVVFQGLLENNIIPITFGYLLFPILVWIVMRFGQRGGLSAIFVMSVVAIWSTLTGAQPLESEVLSKNLVILQSFVAVTAITFMSMAAVVAEREQNLKYRQQLEARTKLLLRQRTQLESINRSKDEFISIASHQLRTPATAVKQYIGMLLDNYVGKVTKSQRDMLKTAYFSNELQLKIINELLSIAQIDTGKLMLNKENLNLRVFVATIIRRQSSLFDAREQEVIFRHIKDKLIVSADKIKFGMVLENVFDNASKYTPRNKKIIIKISRQKGNAVISVKDEGVGIKAKDQRKLFKKFSRISNELSEENSGTGLGLYWAKKIMDAQNGTITVNSKYGQGSTFIISLPIKKR